MKASSPPIIYLDNAATTFPKPPSVVKRVLHTLREECGNPGRSSHRISMRAAERIYECRGKIAKFFGGSEENVVFSSSDTHALNLGIKSVLRSGDHVLLSDIEHNSVIRPIHALAERGLISYSVYRASEQADELTDSLSRLIQKNTTLLIACHHSNICNIVQPLDALGAWCRRHGVLFAVDAAQSAGLLPIDVTRHHIDLLCAPAHKGLYGIPGCGFTLFGEGFTGETAHSLNTLTEGGNGIRSREPHMPPFLPERMEAGTLNVPGIAALSAGIDFLKHRGVERIAKAETLLCKRLATGLQALSRRIHLYGNEKSGGILLFSVDGIPSETLAAALDGYGICVRAGLHCAPTAHKRIGTPSDGAVRVSFGAFNTPNEVAYFLYATERILQKSGGL